MRFKHTVKMYNHNLLKISTNNYTLLCMRINNYTLQYVQINNYTLLYKHINNYTLLCMYINNHPLVYIHINNNSLLYIHINTHNNYHNKYTYKYPKYSSMMPIRIIKKKFFLVYMKMPNINQNNEIESINKEISLLQDRLKINQKSLNQFKNGLRRIGRLRLKQ